MRRSLRLAPLLFLLFQYPGIAQTDSLVDVFPLWVGNSWLYRYESYLHEPPKGLITTDTGSARLTIQSKAISPDSIIWTILQHRDIVQKIIDLGGGGGSIQFIRDTTTINLVELSEGQHKLYTNPAAMNVWNSIFPFGADLTDTTEIFRYRSVNSPGIAAFKTFHQEPWNCPRIRFVFEFRRNLGMTVVSCRESCFTSQFRTNHILLSSTIVNVDESDVAFELLHPSLRQNYPNPFNPTTRIEYSIPQTSHVSLKVFDVLGREVATLVDEVQDSGFKTVTFDASQLTSGVYLYQLRSGEYVSTKRMLLIK